MQNLRALRRSRSLTFLELAALSGVPARQIAEVEYGLRRLDPDERESLARVLGLPPTGFTGAHRRPSAATATLAPAQQRALHTLVAAALAAAVATGATGAVLRAPELRLPAISAPLSARVTGAPAPAETAALSGAAPGASTANSAPVALSRAPTPAAGALDPAILRAGADEAAAIVKVVRTILELRAALPQTPLSPVLVVGPTPPESVAPAPLPVIESAPAFTLTDAGPLGCPVKPTAGRVVVTQGYGVGSHAPAEIWGAVDLAVDGDGDGYAEAGASWYTPIVATHDGRVVATPDSYPGGNYVSVIDPTGVWRTGYGHLALITVADGQYVRAGDTIGLLGSSGMSSGPHLDYQVWRGGVNLDPTGLVGC